MTMDSTLSERAQLLRDAGRVAVPLNIVNASILVAISWSALGGRALAAWLAAMTAVSGVRMLASARFPEPGDEAGLRRWMRVHLFGTALTGALWGGVIFLFPLGAVSHQLVFALFLLAGMTAGATATGAAHLPANIAFNAPALLPGVVFFALSNTFESLAMAAVMLIYLAYLVRTGRETEQAVRLFIRQRNENIALARTLEERTQFTRSILDSLDVGVLVFDQDLRIVAWNPTACRYLDWDPEYLKTKPTYPEMLRYKHARGEFAGIDIDAYIEARVAEMRSVTATRLYLGDKRRPDGRTLEYVYSPAPTGGVVVTITDISERAAHIQQVLHIATHDALTGLANRIKFHEVLDQTMAMADRNGTQLGIYLLDLDDFKFVNDSMGHPMGDELLKQVTQRLRANTRDSDLVARLGGDEFAILGTNLHGVQDASTLAEQILAALGKPYQLGDRTVHSGASIGGTTYPGDRAGAVELIAHADVALYRAKARGKHCFELFDEELNAELLDHKRIEHEIDRGLEQGEFELWYQPLVCLGTGATAGAEALLRWRNRERGLLSPAQFLKVAEESGQIIALTNWVIDDACALLAQLRGTACSAHTIAVNLSTRHLHGSQLIEVARSAVERHGVDSGRLEFEVTETMVLPDVGRALEVINELRRLGFGVAIDDFGTGYSSMSYLKYFRAGKLKLDRSFIDECTENREDRAIIAAAISLGHSLDMRIVAEGIETEAQLAYLREVGCDLGQGYLISRPLPLAQYLAWIEQQGPRVGAIGAGG